MLASALATEAHGLRSRISFTPPSHLGGRCVVATADAADAFHIWVAAGLRGRRLLVLSGQWSRPRNVAKEPLTPEEQEVARLHGETALVDARTALYAAARMGIARTIDVIMPPEALARRLAEVSGAKTLVRENGAFRVSYEGLERRFSNPEAFLPPQETALVLVEPSWFSPGAPSDPVAWLSSIGVTSDLALVALADPAATGEQRLAAARYAWAVGATFDEPCR